MNTQESEIESPLTVKSEVKIEESDAHPVTSPSTHIIQDIVSFEQSTFAKVFIDIIRNSLAEPTKLEPPQDQFSLLIRDPFALNAMSFLNGRLGGFQEDGIPKKPSKCQKRKKTAKTTKKKEHLTEKQQEYSQEKDQKTNEQENITQSPSKTPKKYIQNRIKNIPGLILQRVRTSIKVYLERNPNLGQLEKRLRYLDKVFDCLKKQEKKQALAFLETYEKSWKTWHTIKKYLQTDSKYGSILLDAILEFLKEDGLEDFNNWLTTGKMRDKGKATVMELKHKIGQKFSRILMDFDKEDDNDAKNEEMILIDKIVKKEEDTISKSKEEYI